MSGRIDTSNAAQIQEEVLNILNDTEHNSVVLDLADLEYFSSAGLRLVMVLKKNDEELKIINTTPEVYEIFDATAFNTVIPIERKRRQISVEGIEPMGAELFTDLMMKRLLKYFSLTLIKIKSFVRER